MKISVMLSTYRKGGLDISFAGLLNQTFPKDDWELILVDVWYKDRRNKVKKILGKSGDKINYFHTRPMKTLWPVDSGSMHRNSAIALSEAELCVFFCDYMYVQPSYLQEYWNVFEASRPATPIGPHRYWEYPKRVIPNWQEKKAGISLFTEPWTPADLTEPWHGGPDADPKMSQPAGSISGNYFHMKNETARLDALLTVNGCDEAFDGGHCYSDIELGARLERASNGFLNHTNNIGEIVQIREIYPVCERPRSVEDDFNYWGSRNGAATSPNQYNLAAWRLEILEWKKKRKRKYG